MNGYLEDSFNLVITIILILLNAFFVAAEFALVKVNKSKIKTMQIDQNPFAHVALWLYKRQSKALSACQMGITMASLALGWIGEPALAHLLKPTMESFGITSEAAIHSISFTIAFTIITSLHIVIGEQFPKIYAIRKPIIVVGWASYPLKFFYMLFYPFMWMLDKITSKLLNLVGIESEGEHEAILTEDERRASLSIAYSKGDLTHNEHQLLDAAFKFDDQITRQIMLPRVEVDFFNLNDTYEDNIALAQKTMHTRFPLCNGSLDDIIGIVHIKDLLGVETIDREGFAKRARKPVFVPESLPISNLLQEFRKYKQHLAIVEDEYGTVIGIVTMENVLEQLVGSVQDEFDFEKPDIVKEADGIYLLEGDLGLNYINDYLGINLESIEADSISGLLMERVGYHLEKEQKIKLEEDVTAEIVDLKNRRANKVRLFIHVQSDV